MGKGRSTCSSCGLGESWTDLERYNLLRNRRAAPNRQENSSLHLPVGQPLILTMRGLGWTHSNPGILDLRPDQTTLSKWLGHYSMVGHFRTLRVPQNTPNHVQRLNTVTP